MSRQSFNRSILSLATVYSGYLRAYSVYTLSLLRIVTYHAIPGIITNSHTTTPILNPNLMKRQSE
jgi:hypothetical protein